MLDWGHRTSKELIKLQVSIRRAVQISSPQQEQCGKTQRVLNSPRSPHQLSVLCKATSEKAKGAIKIKL